MANAPAQTPSRPEANELLEVAKTIAAALLIALVLRVMLFQPYTIPSASMVPALRTGDYIVVSKYSYGWSRASVPFNPPLPGGRFLARTPKRGDVIVFRLPRNPNEAWVKRLIGLPGDQVRLAGGVVTVNGRQIPQTAAGFTYDPEAPGRRVMQVLEPRADGRRYVTFDAGPGHEGDDVASFVVPQGHYFFMGDNRDNSLDGRWPREVGVGFVPAENLVGKAQLVLFSWYPGASILKPWTWVSRLRPSRFFHTVV